MQLERFRLSERLWLLAIGLHAGGHRRLASLVRGLNAFLFHNSLHPAAEVAEGIKLGHQGLGVVVSKNVRIGRNVRIWQGVTIAARSNRRRGQGKIVIGDHVTIGANATVITPIGGTLTIGRAARIGAGACIRDDVPENAVMVAPVAAPLARSGNAPAPEDAGEPEAED